jgi:hypothetical protein
MTQPGFRKIIHPLTGGIAEVPVSSLGQHYAAGWAPLDETAEPEPAARPDPRPVRASAAKNTSTGKEGE